MIAQYSLDLIYLYLKFVLILRSEGGWQALVNNLDRWIYPAPCFLVNNLFDVLRQLYDRNWLGIYDVENVVSTPQTSFQNLAHNDLVGLANILNIDEEHRPVHAVLIGCQRLTRKGITNEDA